MNREQFYKLPKWSQKEIKERAIRIKELEASEDVVIQMHLKQELRASKRKTKVAKIDIRLTSVEKKEIADMARILGETVSSYLLRIHWLTMAATEDLRRDAKGR